MVEPTPRPADQLAAVAALARYDLPPESRLQPIRATNNAVFGVTAGGRDDRLRRYVLRVHRPHYRRVEQTWSELYLLRLLQDALPGGGFSVPHPVPARDGTLTVEVSPSQGVTRHCDLLLRVVDQLSLRRPDDRPSVARYDAPELQILGADPAFGYAFRVGRTCQNTNRAPVVRGSAVTATAVRHRG